MSATTPAADSFQAALYATTPRERLLRALELGPRYFLLDLPRYLRARQRLGLPWWDGAALLNPLREFRRKSYATLPLPPMYESALRDLRQAGFRLAMPRLRLEALLGAWWEARSVPGDVIECGAYEGATSLLLALLGQRNGLLQMIHALDTFAGSPPPTRFDGGHRAGEFLPPADGVARLETAARRLGVASRLSIRPGLFSATFESMTANDYRFAFAHIDANLFESTRESCLFTLPRMSPGGIVVFDDYNGVCDLGARLAIDSCLGAARPRPQALAWCSSYLQIPS